ncbi:Calpain-A [Gryllus bimaculatus]|nr:Calpain-A [Gryllus bimaculatus]
MSTAVDACARACSCSCTDECRCEPAYVGRARYDGVAAREAEEFFKDEDFPVGEPTLAGDVPEGVLWRRPHLIPDGLQLKPGGSENKYTGKVTIRLWASGSRFDMKIDDRLPVMNTKDGLKLVFGACKETSEFWLPLVEKAVAKYHRGYKNLQGGQIAVGLMILTGYSVNKIKLVKTKPTENLFTFLQKELARKSLITAVGKTKELIRISTMALENRRDGEESANESMNHSYTVNKVLQLSDSRQLLRIRNPWGTETDCTGKFRITEDVLRDLPSAILDELLQCPCSDGEYWLDEKGFYDKFLELCVANEYPSVSRNKLVPSTNVVSGRGMWVGKTVGGPPGSKTFDNNCQFLFQIDIEDKESVKGKVPVLLELIQDLHRKSSPYKSGMQIYTLKGKLATWQAVGAPLVKRYSWAQLRNSSYAQSAAAAECGVAQACVVRGYFELTPHAPHVAVAWVQRGVPAVGFLLRVYSPAGVVVRLRTLPDPV